MLAQAAHLLVALLGTGHVFLAEGLDALANLLLLVVGEFVGFGEAAHLAIDHAAVELVALLRGEVGRTGAFAEARIKAGSAAGATTTTSGTASLAASRTLTLALAGPLALAASLAAEATTLTLTLALAATLATALAVGLSPALATTLAVVVLWLVLGLGDRPGPAGEDQHYCEVKSCAPHVRKTPWVEIMQPAPVATYQWVWLPNRAFLFLTQYLPLYC